MTQPSGTRGSASYPLLLLGALAGILLFGLVRLAFAPGHENVHYHANFAIVIDGERVDFSGNRYMQDVAACMAHGGGILPEQRAHLHNNDPDVVHVHASGVTWGHFLANLGFALGDDFLVTDDGQWHRRDEERSLHFVVNGHPVPTVHNRLVGPGDRLLVSYGPASLENAVAAHFPLVASNAAQFDTMPDPASCSGPEEQGFGDRLRRAFWF